MSSLKIGRYDPNRKPRIADSVYYHESGLKRAAVVVVVIDDTHVNLNVFQDSDGEPVKHRSNIARGAADGQWQFSEQET